jgi:hypothetical protein
MPQVHGPLEEQRLRHRAEDTPLGKSPALTEASGILWSISDIPAMSAELRKVISTAGHPVN